MAQYRIGTVTVATDSNLVVGVNTLWDEDQVSVGNSFSVVGDSVLYTIASIDYLAQTLLLSINYVGTSGTKQYFITRDFTPNYNIPEVGIGDQDWPIIVTEAFRKIDQTISAAPQIVASVTAPPSTPWALWLDLSTGGEIFAIANELGDALTDELGNVLTLT